MVTPLSSECDRIMAPLSKVNLNKNLLQGSTAKQIALLQTSYFGLEWGGVKVILLKTDLGGSTNLYQVPHKAAPMQPCKVLVQLCELPNAALRGTKYKFFDHPQVSFMATLGILCHMTYTPPHSYPKYEV